MLTSVGSSKVGGERSVLGSNTGGDLVRLGMRVMHRRDTLRLLVVSQHAPASGVQTAGGPRLFGAVGAHLLARHASETTRRLVDPLDFRPAEACLTMSMTQGRAPASRERIEAYNRAHGRQGRLIRDQAGDVWMCWDLHLLTNCNGIHCRPYRLFIRPGLGMVWSDAGPFLRPPGG